MEITALLLQPADTANDSELEANYGGNWQEADIEMNSALLPADCEIEIAHA
ncbi:MAG: hypothetical protein M3X11_14470 [Acidobacteriota bacterium]|nr:hypothetical protein [Acidobacteriota bacterium]